MEADPNPILEDVRAFLSACPDSYDFPIGGELSIPSAFEQKFLTLLSGDVTNQLLESVRQNISRNDAYSLVIFAVRMAVHAARTKDTAPIEKSLWILSVDDNDVDWRDTLIALSIVEDCSARSGFNFTNRIAELAQLAPSRRRKTIEDGYLSRTPEMRDVETLGYKPINPDSNELYYVRDY